LLLRAKHVSLLLLAVALLVLAACDGNTTPNPPSVTATATLSNDPLTRGIGYYERGEYFTAIKDLTEVLKADPDNVEALYHRGWSYLSTNDYELGYADLDRVVKLAPDDARG
jgi:Tfp pilus assembly protein PilF